MGIAGSRDGEMGDRMASDGSIAQGGQGVRLPSPE